MTRPSHNRPVGRWKKVRPLGGPKMIPKPMENPPFSTLTFVFTNAHGTNIKTINVNGIKKLHGSQNNLKKEHIEFHIPDEIKTEFVFEGALRTTLPSSRMTIQLHDSSSTKYQEVYEKFNTFNLEMYYTFKGLKGGGLLLEDRDPLTTPYVCLYAASSLSDEDNDLEYLLNGRHRERGKGRGLLFTHRFSLSCSSPKYTRDEISLSLSDAYGN
ncbi:hypothetical protein F8388_014007 [Cannabis sativa]|uniref:Uncharacterized protein n=1 Tax=Cannabis sativa TaxID=3483 RepID=A0A7J6GKV9_CANSA|nr:hypothetical protein F8388_014007 [Cannabis sativa]